MPLELDQLKFSFSLHYYREEALFLEGLYNVCYHTVLSFEAWVVQPSYVPLDPYIALDESSLHLKVSFYLPDADWAECERLFVRFLDQIRPVHQAFEVGAVRHAEDVAELVAGSLHATVENDVLAVNIFGAHHVYVRILLFLV